MKSTCTALCFALLVLGASGSSFRLKQAPAAEAAPDGMLNRGMDNSFGESLLTPPCTNIKCGQYSCPAPFELKTDDTCCGYCYAEDHVVAADRHVVTEFNATGFVVDYCEGAPSICSGPGVNP